MYIFSCRHRPSVKSNGQKIISVGVVYFPPLDLREKVRQTASSLISGGKPPQHQLLLLWHFPRLWFESARLPASSHNTYCFAKDPATSHLPIHICAKPAAQSCGGTPAAPTSQWLEKDTRLPASHDFWTSHKNPNAMVFWCSVLFLDGIFAACYTVSCNQT